MSNKPISGAVHKLFRSTGARSYIYIFNPNPKAQPKPNPKPKLNRQSTQRSREKRKLEIPFHHYDTPTFNYPQTPPAHIPTAVAPPVIELIIDDDDGEIVAPP